MPFSDWSPRGSPDWENRAEPLSRAELARVDRLARRAENLTADGSSLDVTDSGVHLGPPDAGGFWARITFQAGTSLSWFYTFTEQQWNLAVDDWIDKEGGLVSQGQSEDSPLAVESSRNPNVPAHPERGPVKFLRKISHLRYSFECGCESPVFAPTGTGTGTGTGAGGATDNCAKCSGPTPALVTVTAAGFTVDLAAFNGTWTAEITGDPCRWNFVRGDVSVFVAKLSSGWRVRFATLDGIHEIEYAGGTGLNCCSTTVLPFSADLTTNTGSAHPAQITLTPVCGEVPCSDPCDHLAGGVAPKTWSFTSGGFANGGGEHWGDNYNAVPYTLTKSGAGCLWASPSSHAQLRWNPDISKWVVDLVEPSSGATASYLAATPAFTDGCSPQVFNRVGASALTPATLTLTPAGGCCPGSTGVGGGGGGTVVTGCCPGGLPNIVHATFAGTLAALGVVTLTWSGSNWLSAPYAACGGGTVALNCFGTSWLLSAGTIFTVTPTGTCSPFLLTAAGTASGACAGAASVTVNP